MHVNTHDLNSLSNYAAQIDLNNSGDHLEAIKSLLVREKKYSCKNYINSPLNTQVSESQRSSYFEFLVKLTEAVGFKSYVSEAAMSIFDRANQTLLSKNKNIDPSLLLIVSLMIASKTSEKVIFGIEAAMKSTNCFFSEQEIRQTEFEVLNLINWDLSPPTFRAYFEEFCGYLGAGADAKNILFESYLEDSKSTIFNAEFLGQPRLKIAVAMFLNALENKGYALNGLVSRIQVQCFEHMLVHDLNIHPRGDQVHYFKERLKSISSLPSLDQVVLF